MPYVVIVHSTFNNKSDADHIYDQAKSVATNASVALIGTEEERTSHAFVAEEVTGGEWNILTNWYTDLFNIVREGTQPETTNAPVWIQPTGSHDAYPATNVRGNETHVTHNGQVWRNTHGDGNVWEPGVSGWEVLS